MSAYRTQRGFTYLVLLFAIAFASLVLAGQTQSWIVQSRQMREAEWMYRGGQYRLALQSYRAASPDGLGPDSLEQLLEDTRNGKTVRHLRQLYLDPITRGPWELQLVGGKIAGVYSSSSEKPLHQFENVYSYREKIF